MPLGLIYERPSLLCSPLYTCAGAVMNTLITSKKSCGAIRQKYTIRLTLTLHTHSITSIQFGLFVLHPSLTREHVHHHHATWHRVQPEQAAGVEQPPRKLRLRLQLLVIAWQAWRHTRERVLGQEQVLELEELEDLELQQVACHHHWCRMRPTILHSLPMPWLHRRLQQHQ